MARKALCVALAVMLAVPALGQARPKQVQQAPGQPKQKQQVQKFATCRDAMDQTPGYSQVSVALKNCPDLQRLQTDPNAAMTYFVPSDKAVKSMAAYLGVAPAMVSSPQFKGIMCNVLKYHMVPGVHLKKNWQVGQQLTTAYNKAALQVTAVGQQPQIQTTTGVKANIKRVTFCGNSVAFGIDAVLTPFKVPKLGRTKPTV